MKISVTILFLLIFISVPDSLLFGDSPAQRAIKIQPVEKTHFTFYFDNPAYIDKADSILNKTRQLLISLLRDSLDYIPSVYLLEEIHLFNNLISGKFPDWGAAAAYPERKLIALKSPDKFNLNKSLEELLAHEYAHLVIDHSCGFYKPPRWFNEGLSMYVSSEWSWSDNMAMGKAAVFGQLIPLDEIEFVNRFNESKAHVAYAESYLAVQYMIKTYGKNSINLFLMRISQNKSVDEALYSSTGLTLKEFQDDFTIYISKQFNFVSLFMDTIFFWIALSLIVVIAFFIKFKKRREFYKKWEEEDKLASKDFDYGDTPEQLDKDDDEAWRS